MIYVRQKYKFSCGPACMKMILSSFDMHRSRKWLMRELKTTHRWGTNRAMLAAVCDKLDLDFVVRRGSNLRTVHDFIEDGYRVIVNYTPKGDKFSHFAIVRRMNRENIFLHDPWYGPDHRVSRSFFIRRWFDEKNERWFIAIKKHDDD